MQWLRCRLYSKLGENAVTSLSQGTYKYLYHVFTILTIVVVRRRACENCVAVYRIVVVLRGQRDCV